LLLFNETSASTLFTHVTFGLLDGWWRFEDAELRIPGSPSLTPGSWRGVLEDAGFTWVAGTSDREHALGQQIVAATSRAAVPASAPAPRQPAHDSMTTRDLILALLSETLNVEASSIDVNALFSDYGLDSILGVEFIHKLRRALGIELEVSRLFDFSTVAQLANFLGEHRVTAAAKPVVTQAVAPAIVPAAPAHREPIAIVGMSGRFARSENVEQLWEHLLAGRDLVEPVSRFDLEA
jgi:acyl carrier protein